MTFRNKHISMKGLQEELTLMLHGIGFITGDPSIRISYPYVFHPGVRITVKEPGEAKWIYMMLPLPKGSLITQVKIAYHIVGIQSHISLVRLVEQREAVAATVLHNEVIEKPLPSSGIIRAACKAVVSKSTLLKICMEFENSDDIIEFGGVEVNYIPHFNTHSEEEEEEEEEENKKTRMNKSLIYIFGNDGKNRVLSHNLNFLSSLFFKTKKRRQFNINIENTL